MSPLRFAIFGAGFWSRYQLAAWRELEGVECVAVYNRTRSKAEALASEFSVPAVYDDPEALLRGEKIDFIDIVTDVDTHRRFVEMGARSGLPVICQKPMALSLRDAERMVQVCEKVQVPLFVHENFRWQRPIRAAKEALDSGVIGRPFRARIDMISGFPVFKNQPFLKTLEQFILTDLVTHILDVARFLIGEAEALYCQTQRVHSDIQGEDVATVMMRMGGGTTVICEMAYAENFLERDRFPETFLFIEGDKGSIELGPDYWLRVTTKRGTHAKRHAPVRYGWADPAYEVVHSSIVPCHRNLLDGLRHRAKAETTGRDNLRTLELAYAAYESAQSGNSVTRFRHSKQQ